MRKNIITALRVSLFTLFITGLVYPFLVTEISKLFFHYQAKGSLIINESQKIIGSELIGQSFKTSAYFFSRPSSAGKGYDALDSGGSNDSPSSKKLIDRVQAISQDIRG